MIVESKEMIGSFKDFNISEDSTTTVTTPPQDTPPQTVNDAFKQVSCTKQIFFLYSNSSPRLLLLWVSFSKVGEYHSIINPLFLPDPFRPAPSHGGYPSCPVPHHGLG